MLRRERSRKMLSYAVFRSQKGAFCVELWTFYFEKRILVPMFDIAFWYKRSDSKTFFYFFWGGAPRGVLMVRRERSRRELSTSVFRSPKGAFCVELWTFYFEKRISVPMFDVVFSEPRGSTVGKSCNRGQKNKLVRSYETLQKHSRTLSNKNK